MRRDTIGAKPSFAILETGMNLPDEAVQHPVIQEMSILSIDMILLGNVSGHPISPIIKLTTVA